MALLLALHAAGHQGTLGGVEAGDSAAGHGDEHEAPHGSSLGMHGTEVIPDLRNGVLRLDKDAHGHADGHDDQANAEQRIDLADNLVNGNKGGDEIIHQDDNQPEQSGGDNAGGAAVFEQGDDQAGRTHGEHGAHHDQQHHAEHTHDVLHEAAQVDTGDLGDGSAVVALAHHAGEVVMHCTGKDRTKGDPQEHDGAPQSALHSAEDGTKARDVQQLDHEQLPLGKDHIVHTVVDLHSGGLAVVRPEGVFHHLAIDEITADEQGQANQKANHFSPPLFIHHNVLEQKDATPLAFRSI